MLKNETFVFSIKKVSEYGLTQYRSFLGWLFQAECTQTLNNRTVSLTFTETQNTQKKWAKPKIVRTLLYASMCNVLHFIVKFVQSTLFLWQFLL